MDKGRNRGVLGHHHLSLTEEGLREITDVGESFKQWSGIEKVDAIADHILIFTQVTAAHVVPRRAFSDAHAAEAFLAEARRLWDSAK
jgi:hypothetical protein